ncbi:ATP-binding protein [Nisaea denitrificans]|uniref:ATP-binding protein n=1 Tax=Nisaea denitrificans TaxID=390877 RepID=UPI001969F0A3|nr:ATP-binding protein [Nisaea denitrificans]
MIYRLWHRIAGLWTASIRRQLMLGIIAVHAVLMTIFVFDLVIRQQAFLAEQGVSQTRSLAETMAANSTSWVLANDVLGLEEVVSSQSRYPGLIYAMIISPEARVLGHSDRQYVGQFLQDERSLSLLAAERSTLVLNQNNHLIDVAAPVMVNGQHIAWARVAISRDDVVRNLDIVTRDGILYTLAAIVVGMLFAFFMARGMTASLQQMVSVANDLREGKPETRIAVNRGDELGSLGNSFNALADAVEKREAELRHHRDHLEELVSARTKDLIKEVSERKQAEEDLRESRAAIEVSEGRLRRILDSSSAGISVVQQEPLKRLYANQRFFQMFGLDPDAAIETTDFMITYRHAADADLVLGLISRGEGFNNIVIERAALDGKLWWSWLDGIPIEFEGVPAVIIWHFDVTDQKRAEADLIQSEKMASLGGLVAGVAHEINTPIGIGVTASSHMLEISRKIRETILGGPVSRQKLEQILSDLEETAQITSSNLFRAAELIRSFKQVAADQSSDARRTFDLAKYLDEIATSMKPRLAQSGHSLSLDCEQSVSMDTFPGSLSQIVTNIVLNAVIHAFDTDADGKIQISARKENNHAVLAISDNGKGMDRDTVKRIFDPFFTTARGHGGTGLGLHIVFNQVTQVLGGTIQCSSSRGNGTTFTIRCPLIASEQVAAT